MARYDLIAVYILASKRNGTLYTGVTSDLRVRMGMHRDGKVEGFALKCGCKQLVWIHDTMLEAIKREKQIKRWLRAWKLELIEKSNPQWRDLASDLMY